jgi:Fe-S cluster biosynthesis and repair protein YggX
MCLAGSHARPLPQPPIPDEMGKRIQAEICADCWNDWFRNYSIKVINELRLDLSTEHGQAEYDRYMREFLGLE